MTRKNAEVERLEALLATHRRADAERRKPPVDLPVTGCGDTSCEVAVPTGMAPTGRCRCNERTLRQALRWQKRRGEFLEQTSVDLREAAQRDGIELDNLRNAGARGRP